MIARALWIAAWCLLLGTSPVARAVFIEDIEAALLNDESDSRFANARNRIAVFTLEDPDGTGLGDAIAFLITQRVLFDAEVGSLAIVLFQSGLADDSSGLSYFDKVEQLTGDRGYVAAIWGNIARDGEAIVVDTFLQLFPSKLEPLAPRELTLDALGRALSYGISPLRLPVRTTRFSADEIERIRETTQSVRTLRRNPDVAADTVDGGLLDTGTSYYVKAREGSWRRLSLNNGVVGWTSVDVICGEVSSCRALLAPADFTNEVLRYGNELTDEIYPDDLDSHVAQAIAAQVRVVETLARSRPTRRRLAEAAETAASWTEDRAPPGGATFTNPSALVHLLRLSRAEELTPQTALPVAGTLARATLNDPGNLHVLHNLWVLFAYIGDDERSTLAHRLYREQLVRARAR